MKPYSTKPKKFRHQTVVKGHPHDCGGCHRNVKLQVEKSKKVVRRKGRESVTDMVEEQYGLGYMQGRGAA